MTRIVIFYKIKSIFNISMHSSFINVLKVYGMHSKFTNILPLTINKSLHQIGDLNHCYGFITITLRFLNGYFFYADKVDCNPESNFY